VFVPQRAVVYLDIAFKQLICGISPVINVEPGRNVESVLFERLGQGTCWHHVRSSPRFAYRHIGGNIL
jgi:hypothetical protein